MSDFDQMPKRPIDYCEGEALTSVPERELRRWHDELERLKAEVGGLAFHAVRADERLACWKIAEEERKTAAADKQAWLVAFDIANAIKMRGIPDPVLSPEPLRSKRVKHPGASSQGAESAGVKSDGRK